MPVILSAWEAGAEFEASLGYRVLLCKKKNKRKQKQWKRLESWLRG